MAVALSSRPLASRKRPLRAIGLHAYRWALLLAICWLVRTEHKEWRLEQIGRRDAKQLLQHVIVALPQARSLAAVRETADEWYVLAASGMTIGRCLTTSPLADDVVGFSGPTNVLLVFDDRDILRGATILDSQDTAEHVAQVRADRQFLRKLVGKSRKQLARLDHVDGVSGATLTSMAILESVRQRAGGENVSLRFPKPLTVDDAKRFFPQAHAIRPVQSIPFAFRVVDAKRHVIGTLYRTSPLADSLIGYQGPTDAVFAFDSRGKLVDYHIRKSFDNQPYVRYVEEDRDLRYLLRGKALAELAADGETLDIEGVSGATMTSQALVAALRRIAREAQRPEKVDSQASRRPSSLQWTAHDSGTLAVVLGSLIIAFSRWKRSRRVWLAWQVLLVGYFGFVNGDMLSQALLVGWVQNAVPWQRAPALTLLAALAFVLPAAGGGPWYCQCACPFGAAQGLVRGRRAAKWRVRGRWLVILKAVPATLILLVLFAAFHEVGLALAAIEPFHAFLWPVAGWATIAIAVVGLLASRFIPKAYCRFGCPTGAILEFGRWTRTSGWLRRRDWVATALLGIAVCLRYAASPPSAPTQPPTPSEKNAVGHAAAPTPLRKADGGVRHLTGSAMGTTWEVSWVPVPGADSEQIRHAIATRLEQLEAQFSHWRAASTVSVFNRSERGMPVDAEFARVVTAAMSVHRASSGAFDVTAAPLIALWGFGPHGEQHRPTRAQWLACRQRVGSNLLTLTKTGEQYQLAKTRPDVELDFSGIAKGFAVDEVAAELRRCGIRQALVGIGGEYYAMGTIRGRPWHIGIERPENRLGARSATTVLLHNMAIATSGTYRQFRSDERGHRHSHIVDPRTGLAAENHVVQVSVIAPTAMIADAWATALMVMEPRRAADLAERYGLAARIVTQRDQRLEEHQNSLFGQYETTAASVGVAVR